MPRRLSKMACWRDLPRHEQDTASATRQNVDGTKDEGANRDMSATQRNFYIFGDMMKLNLDTKTP